MTSGKHHRRHWVRYVYLLYIQTCAVR